MEVLGVHDQDEPSSESEGAKSSQDAKVKSMKRVAKENKSDYLAKSVEELH